MMTLLSDREASRLNKDSKVVVKLYSSQTPCSVDDTLHLMSNDGSIDHLVVVKHVEGPFTQQGRQHHGYPFYLLTLVKHKTL